MVALVTVAAVGAGAADAQIRLRPDRNEFYFHGALGPYAGPNVSKYGATVEAWAWNDEGTAETTRIAAVTLPAGACVDRGTSCRFLDRTALTNRSGLFRFKMNYSKGKIWMRSFVDVTGATKKMTIYVRVHTQPYDTVYAVSAVFRLTKKGWLLPDNDPQW
jgi:hypothetical protein